MAGTENGSGEVVVAVVVVVGNLAGEGLMTVGGVVVASVGAFDCDEPPECFGDGFGEKRAGDGCRLCDGPRVEAGEVGGGPLVRGQLAQLRVGEAVGSEAGASGEEPAPRTGESFRGTCVPHERGGGRLRHCLTFRRSLGVTIQPQKLCGM